MAVTAGDGPDGLRPVRGATVCGRCGALRPAAGEGLDGARRSAAGAGRAARGVRARARARHRRRRRAAQEARREPVQAGVGGRDELGMSSRASAGGPDPRRLATNRGEQETRKPIKVDKQPGRNEPCPCGSGKKYKKCHGR